MDVDQVAEILKQAEQAVEKAGIRSELQSAALDKAVELLSGTAPRAAPGKQTADPKLKDRDKPSALSLEPIAWKLGKDLELVEEVYGIDDGELKIILPASKLEHSKKGGTKQLALLVSAGRQAARLDGEWTESSEIREVCRDFSRFDSANFASTLKSLDDELRFTGSAQSIKVKVNRHGWEKAGELVEQLAGGS